MDYLKSFIYYATSWATDMDEKTNEIIYNKLLRDYLDEVITYLRKTEPDIIQLENGVAHIYGYKGDKWTMIIMQPPSPQNQSYILIYVTGDSIKIYKSEEELNPKVLELDFLYKHIEKQSAMVPTCPCNISIEIDLI
jgi:hypothetical protein